MVVRILALFVVAVEGTIYRLPPMHHKKFVFANKGEKEPRALPHGEHMYAGFGRPENHTPQSAIIELHDGPSDHAFFKGAAVRGGGWSLASFCGSRISLLGYLSVN